MAAAKADCGTEGDCQADETLLQVEMIPADATFCPSFFMAKDVAYASTSVKQAEEIFVLYCRNREFTYEHCAKVAGDIFGLPSDDADTRSFTSGMCEELIRLADPMPRKPSNALIARQNDEASDSQSSLEDSLVRKGPGTPWAPPGRRRSPPPPQRRRSPPQRRRSAPRRRRSACACDGCRHPMTCYNGGETYCRAGSEYSCNGHIENRYSFNHLTSGECELAVETFAGQCEEFFSSRECIPSDVTYGGTLCDEDLRHGCWYCGNHNQFFFNNCGQSRTATEDLQPICKCIPI